MIALQLGITQTGGMIQTGPTYFGSALLRNGEKSRWVATGSYNQRSIAIHPFSKKMDCCIFERKSFPTPLGWLSFQKSGTTL
ncbi:MAG: hypothetical protein R2877_02945 [Bdellovibrionota bacterium]